jgi:hypothetical protein
VKLAQIFLSLLKMHTDYIADAVVKSRVYPVSLSILFIGQFLIFAGALWVADVLLTTVFHGLDGYNGRMYSYLLIHIPFIFVVSGVRQWAWYLLTFVHGIAHVTHPALFGVVFNTNYTPLYDYIVHAAQCLCVWYWNQDHFPIGVMTSQLMLTGAAIAHVHQPFLQTFLWIVISGFGVYGTQYHMQLLNVKKHHHIFVCGWIIWLSPYLGYLVPGRLPEWDAVTNYIGLFRVWFVAFYLTMISVGQHDPLDEAREDQSMQIQQGKRVISFIQTDTAPVEGDSKIKAN